MKRLSLQDRVRAVCREASLAKRHFEVYRVYSEPGSRGRLFDALDDYADFVLLDERAHRDLAILRAVSLFDTKEHTTHLPDIVRELKTRGSTPELVAEAEASLTRLEAAVKKLRIIRHNAIAHRSATVSYDEAFDRAQITVDELGDLVASAEAVARALAKATGCEPVIMAYYAANALDRLFTDVGRMRQQLKLGQDHAPR